MNHSIKVFSWKNLCILLDFVKKTLFSANKNIDNQPLKHMSKDKIVSLFDRNKENYAKLLKNFVRPVKDEYQGSELFEIGLSAWNTSNMLVEMPDNFIDPQFVAAQAGVPEDVLEVLEFLIKRKQKYFSQYDLFIYDFEILDKNEEISVHTMPLDEYMAAVHNIMNDKIPDNIFDGLFDDVFHDIFSDDYDDDYDDDDIYDDHFNINREAVFIQSKQPVWKYLVKHCEYFDKNDAETLPSKIILFFNRFVDFDAWLDDNYKKIMKNILLDYIDEDQLPKNFSLKKFKTWFDYQYCDSVDDLEVFD